MLDFRWIVPLAVLHVTAIWFAEPLLALATSLALSLSGSIWIWRRFCLVGVSYRRKLSARRAQFGEVVEFTTEIDNLKILPVPLLEIDDQLPRHLTIEGAPVRPARQNLLPSLCIVRSLWPYARLRTRHRVPCLRRGKHEFGPARWRSGDFLGLRPQYGGTNDVDQLVVFPKVFPLELGPIASSELIGRQAARRSLFTDPLRTAGRRDYVSGDPMRMVDWRATARRNVLTVKQLESSTAPSLQLAINFSVRRPTGDPYAPEELEFAISLAASLAVYAGGRGWPLGLIGNSTADGAAIALLPSSAPTQLALIMETLALANTIPNEPLADLLLRRTHSSYQRGSFAVVTSEPDPALCEVLSGLRRRGHSVMLILVAREHSTAVDVAGIPVLRADFEPDWMTREALVLAS